MNKTCFQYLPYQKFITKWLFSLQKLIPDVNITACQFAPLVQALDIIPERHFQISFFKNFIAQCDGLQG